MESVGRQQIKTQRALCSAQESPPPPGAPCRRGECAQSALTRSKSLGKSAEKTAATSEYDSLRPNWRSRPFFIAARAALHSCTARDEGEPSLPLALAGACVFAPASPGPWASANTSGAVISVDSRARRASAASRAAMAAAIPGVISTDAVCAGPPALPLSAAAAEVRVCVCGIPSRGRRSTRRGSAATIHAMASRRGNVAGGLPPSKRVGTLPAREPTLRQLFVAPPQPQVVVARVLDICPAAHAGARRRAVAAVLRVHKLAAVGKGSRRGRTRWGGIAQCPVANPKPSCW
jgi:hypothetical protein